MMRKNPFFKKRVLFTRTEGDLHMAKGKTNIFFCQSCGYETSKWMGQCPGCKEWNTFVEEAEEDKEFLQLFSFICMLSYDIYIRKQIIEKIVDTMLERTD